jgi:hypothetical protein
MTYSLKMRTIMRTKTTMTTMTMTNLMVWYASPRKFPFSSLLSYYLSLRGIPMRNYRQCDEGLVVEEGGVAVVVHQQRT